MSEPDIDRMKDALQSAFNRGAFICPLAGQDKPDNHVRYCEPCTVRAWLTPGWYLKSDTKLLAEEL